MLLKVTCISEYILKYYGMTPESRDSEARTDSIARQRLGKRIPVATNTQAEIEELPFRCSDEVGTPL
jgi:hypothetical protein